jgi:hypothetical protein
MNTRPPIGNTPKKERKKEAAGRIELPCAVLQTAA